MFRTNTINKGAFTDPWPACPPCGKAESGYQGANLLEKQVQNTIDTARAGGKVFLKDELSYNLKSKTRSLFYAGKQVDVPFRRDAAQVASNREQGSTGVPF